ncbi:MAG TPA: molybdopterin-synthase adenylyltransferase MoeB [Draconibacterium sp.]|nr:molybdopterin-synthase adenylyltransferase MoeB [Draconibacterium sp.]
MNFSEEQIERYSRHLILQNVGIEGQQKILESKVLIVGAGGLGSPAALYLAAAGVGTIGLIDGDVVDRTNLQRQVIHFTPDVDIPKVDSAKQKINQLNPDVKVNTYPTLLMPDNATEIISEYDFVIDGTDNFPTKFMVNDACVLAKKPYSHGGILRFEGQTMTYVPGSACYRCVFDGPPPKDAVPSCSQAGVLGSIAGMLGTIQATEALKYIVGVGELLTNRMLIFDALKMNFREVKFNQSSGCKVCGDHPSISTIEMEELPTCDLH